MPRINPKHQKKKIVAMRQQKFSRGHFPWRYLLMFVIFVAVIGITVAIVMLSKSPEETTDTVVVQEYDKVIVHYKLWIDSDHDLIVDWRNSPPDQESATFSTNVSKDATILGFYQHLLGKRQGESERFILEPNVDYNGDGIDDVTNKEVLGYGDPGHDLFNTTLVYWIQIINITKSKLYTQNNNPEFHYNSAEVDIFNQITSIRNLFVSEALF